LGFASLLPFSEATFGEAGFGEADFEVADFGEAGLAAALPAPPFFPFFFAFLASSSARRAVSAAPSASWASLCACHRHKQMTPELPLISIRSAQTSFCLDEETCSGSKTTSGCGSPFRNPMCDLEGLEKLFWVTRLKRGCKALVIVHHGVPLHPQEEYRPQSSSPAICDL